MKKIIRAGTIITASDTFQADILIEGEQIKLIGSKLEYPDAQVIDAQGKYITPGGVDPHTHFDLPMFGTVSSDDHYTGHKAAAYGGTTTVIDFVPHEPSGLEESIQKWHNRVGGKAVVDYGFHMNITSWDEHIARQVTRLPEMGISSLKVFMAYNNRLRLQDDDIFRVLRLAGENGLLTMLHAENGDVTELLVAEALSAGHTSPEWHALTRPAWGAVEATLRGIALAAQAGAPLYIVHMNATGEVDMLKYARDRGLPVMGETCPQYLLLTQDLLSNEDGAKYVCSPPLRNRPDNDRLWQGLADGTIRVIGTDHCPFFYNGGTPILYEDKWVAIPGKELGKDNFTLIPNGLPAVGDRMPILWTYGVHTGRISANQFVALTSTNPAKIFGLYPQKGALLPGADADIVIWDPDRQLTYGTIYSQHRTDYNLFEGWQLNGFPEKVFLRGNLIVDDGVWLGSSGSGRFLFRKKNNPVL
jgi:dihydropyrimidinase